MIEKINRRRFLVRSGHLALGLSAQPFLALGARLASGSVRSEVSPDYGPLLPAVDLATGFPLLRLPEGFVYRSFGWTGDPMADGYSTPPAHDGMAVVSRVGDVIHLVRNHEVVRPGEPIGGGELPLYDPKGRGGTTTLRFDTKRGEWVDAFASLSGTAINCAGGPTPWGTWLSCEETVSGESHGFDRPHGWVFEVPASGVSTAEPIRAMGRFRHEAVAIDPRDGYAYETEDSRARSGLYRFVPSSPGRLAKGGRLQMLSVVDQPGIELGRGRVSDRMKIDWIDIDDPLAKSASVFEQGVAGGGARFHRLEGIWYDEGYLYFVDTEGGDDVDSGGPGRVWTLHPETGSLDLLFQSPSPEVANQPDNVAVSERGGILLCEDGGGLRDPESDELVGGERLLGLTREGQVFPFAENALRLDGSDDCRGFTGDFRAREWAGVDFYGEWLFANAQVPGITFAITGPWSRGGL